MAGGGRRERRVQPRAESAATCPSVDPGLGLRGRAPGRSGRAEGRAPFPATSAGSACVSFRPVASGPGIMETSGCLQDAGPGPGRPSRAVPGAARPRPAHPAGLPRRPHLQSRDEGTGLSTSQGCGVGPRALVLGAPRVRSGLVPPRRQGRETARVGADPVPGAELAPRPALSPCANRAAPCLAGEGAPGDLLCSLGPPVLLGGPQEGGGCSPSHRAGPRGVPAREDLSRQVCGRGAAGGRSGKVAGCTGRHIVSTCVFRCPA